SLTTFIFVSQLLVPPPVSTLFPYTTLFRSRFRANPWTRFRNGLSTRFRAMQHRNFQLFIAGQLTSLVGTWMQTTAQLWLVYRLTGSAALLGIFGFASQLPLLFLSWIGGYIGYHYNRQIGRASCRERGCTWGMWRFG